MSESPHPLSDQWMSFELRMRQRRFARCIQRAESALDANLLDDARAALEEARQLQNDGHALSALEQRLEALRVVASDRSVSAIASDASVSETTPETSEVPAGNLERPPSENMPSRSRTSRALVTIAAGIAVIATGAAIGAIYWNGRQASHAGSTASSPPARPVEVQRVATAAVSPAKQELDRLQIVHETVNAPETAPRLLVAEPLLPSYPGPPIAAPEPQPEPEPVMLAVNRGETTPPPEVRSEPRLEPVAPPTSPIDPPGRTVEPVTAPAVTPAVRTTPAPPAPEEPVVRDESVVRAVLRRYETAYSNLDADAASVVWPGVNRGALARAFDGLASQQVSLGSCDVTVNGPAASATCSGSATWQPKVGGGVRTEARRWSFDLRKNGEAWRIERAVAR